MPERRVALMAAFVVGMTLMVGAGSSSAQKAPAAKARTPAPAVTPVAGPSWINHLGLRYGDTSLGRTAANYGPSPTQRPSPSSPAPLGVGRSVELSGADLYRLNCQACHRAEGTGAPPEIKSVLGLAQGSSLAVVRRQLQAAGNASGPAAREQASRARTDLYQRIRHGGQRMPPREHLQESDIDAIYAYLTQLAGNPDAPPQSHQTTSWDRLGEHVVKGTCHICHDAAGPRPSRQAVAEGTIPPFTMLLQDKVVVEFVTKVRSGAPVTAADPSFHYRGRMPVFSFIDDVEVAAAYMFLVNYPPQAEESKR